MNLRTASRAVASVVIASLVVAIPGPDLWAQTAAAARAGSSGLGASGAGVTAAFTAGAPAAGATLSLPGQAALSPSVSPALSIAPLAAAAVPLAAAPSAVPSAAAPLALAPAARPAAAESGLPGAKTETAYASAARALAPSSPAASAPEKGDVRARLASLFDGLIARRPARDAVEAGEPGDAPRGSGLKRPQHSLMPVLVTLSDPGSPEALTAILEKMGADLGLRVDSSFAPVRTPGAVAVRALIPVSRLFALRQTPGVIAIEGAAPVAVPPSAPSAPAAAAAPAGENLLRAGLRRLLVTKPVAGQIAILPLVFGTFVAFMAPVTGGIALGGAAAVLKPWMLGTVFGMITTYSYLAPLLAKVDLRLRAAAAFAAAGGLAWTFYALVPGVPALWLAANLALAAVAAFRGASVRAAAGPKSALDKAVDAAEGAAFVNILGYQAALPILILAGMMPLVWGILAVSTVLALSLLIRSGDGKTAAAAAPAPPAAALAPNGAPSAPDQGPAPKPAKPSKPAAKKVREPFVPASRVVADMEKLLKTNPDEALRTAAAFVTNEKERRIEVKIGAQRIMDQLPVEKTLPHYLDLLKQTARTGIQTSKDVNIDPWWYLQRTALRRLARDAAALTPASGELVDALRASYKDRNASVRLAAGQALIALGVDPGPEPTYNVRVEPSAPQRTLAPQQTPQAPKKTFVTWIPTILMAVVLGWMALTMMNAKPTAPVTTPPAITQTIPAEGAASGPSIRIEQEKSPAEQQAEALERIAKDAKRAADAGERQAKAMEELAKPKSGGFLSGALGQLFWIVAGAFIFLFIMRKFMGGGGAPGINTKPDMGLEKPTTKFDDVAGIDESMVEVQEILDFLREPAEFKRLGARMPKGILMEGPPGTGKTLLARALAGETDANFISISGSSFVELYVGMGARRVRELFEKARQNAPAIIFIDEIDAVGKKRGDGGPGNGGNDEREQTINQILKEMDGFDGSKGVIVVAATNRIDTLDSALTRPGRFDRKLHVGLPEALGREAILSLHAKRARLGPDVDLRLIARRTAGLSGAFLESVINEALLLAKRRGGDSASAADIDEAVDRATIGGKRSLRLSEPLKRRIAAHEAGHVLANLLNENPELRVPVNKVTIIPHGSGALGFAETGSEEGDKYLYTREELEARLDTILGGLVAESIFYGGQWSTGPGSDLEAATRTARAMVQQLGMTDLGLAQTAPNQYGQSAFGSEIDAKALAEVNKLLDASRKRVEARLRAGGDKHKAMIEALMEKETLSADEIQAIAHPKN